MHQTYTKIEASLSKEEIPRLPTGQLPPLWMRTSFIRDGHHGREIDRVMVPIEVFGEVALFMRACYDGIPMVFDDGHAYVPASWVIQMRPEIAAQVEVVARRIVELDSEAVDESAA